MRRKEREISTQEAMGILKKVEYGILSIASLNGKPYGVPLNYCVLNDAIYFHCAAAGMKLDILAENHSVSFCAVGETEVLAETFGMKYESAVVSGYAQEVTGSEKQMALEGLVKKYSQRYFDKGLGVIKKDFDRTRVFKINIHSISGKARR